MQCAVVRWGRSPQCFSKPGASTGGACKLFASTSCMAQSATDQDCRDFDPTVPGAALAIGVRSRSFYFRCSCDLALSCLSLWSARPGRRHYPGPCCLLSSPYPFPPRMNLFTYGCDIRHRLVRVGGLKLRIDNVKHTVCARHVGAHNPC